MRTFGLPRRLHLVIRTPKTTKPKQLNPTFNVRARYNECKIQNNIALAQYATQWTIFSAKLWTPTLQTTSGKKDSDTTELTTQPNTCKSFRKCILQKFVNKPIQLKANAVFQFCSSNVRKRGSLPLPYNTPKQTSNEPNRQYPLEFYKTVLIVRGHTITRTLLRSNINK